MTKKIDQRADPISQLRDSLDELQSFEHVDGVLEHIDVARRCLMLGHLTSAFGELLAGWRRVTAAANSNYAAASAAYTNWQRV